MAWSEDRLHRWILELRASAPEARFVVGPPGSDAAVLARGAGRTVLCADQTIEGVHFAPGTPAARAGRKALDRAISDLAAAAARPRAVLLALHAPREAPEAWLRAAIRAVWRRAREHGAELVGGDLACAPGPIALCVAAVGELELAGPPPARSRARPGEVLVLTGPVGGSGLGRHLAIEPRLAEGRWLAARGARAMMDTTDGLGRDAHRMARLSGVALELEHVPLHRDARRAARRSGRSPLDHALQDGEDHELLATLPPRALARVLRERARRCPGLEVVGRVREGSGLRVLHPEGWRAWRGGGYVHGER